MLDWKNAEAPEIADIEDLAREAIAGLPPEFAGPAAQVVLRWHIQLGNIVFPKSTSPARIR